MPSTETTLSIKSPARESVPQNKYITKKERCTGTQTLWDLGSISRDNEPQSQTSNNLVVDNINRAGSDANEGIQQG